MRLTVSAYHFDSCHSDYVTDWSGIVVGISLAGQGPYGIAREVADQAIYDQLDDALVDALTDDMVRDAVVRCLKPGARFWPVDDSGNEIQTDDLDDPRLQQDQPSAWFRLTIAMDES